MDILDEIIRKFSEVKLNKIQENALIKHPIYYNDTNDHKGLVDFTKVDKYTCAYCYTKFISRNNLFNHLILKGVDTSCKDPVKRKIDEMEIDSVSIDENWDCGYNPTYPNPTYPNPSKRKRFVVTRHNHNFLDCKNNLLVERKSYLMSHV